MTSVCIWSALNMWAKIHRLSFMWILESFGQSISFMDIFYLFYILFGRDNTAIHNTSTLRQWLCLIWNHTLELYGHFPLFYATIFFIGLSFRFQFWIQSAFLRKKRTRKFQRKTRNFYLKLSGNGGGVLIYPPKNWRFIMWPGNFGFSRYEFAPIFFEKILKCMKL